MPDSVRTLPDLIDRLNAGDQSASDELFTRLYHRLVHLARLQICNFPDVSRRHDAESFVHQAWIDLQTALRTVKPAQPAAYLTLAARKSRLALLDLVEKERRRLDALRRMPGPRATSASSVIDPIGQSSLAPDKLDAWTRFHQAVGELPDELRRLFELHFYTDADLNWGQFGNLVGLPAHTARRRVAKAKTEIARRVIGLDDLFS
jgi:DNA-directed RNA polymerase specialized sigma24 family protein